jgi:hypothetical protein
MFRDNAHAMRELASRIEAVYARWGRRPDPFSQAQMAYAIALSERVDKRILGWEEANALLEKMKADIEEERRKLAPDSYESEAERHAAMFQRWIAFWNNHRQTYQASRNDPVYCTLIRDREGNRSVRCQ